MPWQGADVSENRPGSGPFRAAGSGSSGSLLPASLCWCWWCPALAWLRYQRYTVRPLGRGRPVSVVGDGCRDIQLHQLLTGNSVQSGRSEYLQPLASPMYSSASLICRLTLRLPTPE